MGRGETGFYDRISRTKKKGNKYVSKRPAICNIREFFNLTSSMFRKPDPGKQFLSRKTGGFFRGCFVSSLKKSVVGRLVVWLWGLMRRLHFPKKEKKGKDGKLPNLENIICLNTYLNIC